MTNPTDELIERLEGDDPQDWHDKQKELLEWTSSAFLACEPVEDEDDHKIDLRSYLCGLIGYLGTGEQNASLMSEAAQALRTHQQSLEQAVLAEREAIVAWLRSTLETAEKMYTGNSAIGHHVIGTLGVNIKAIERGDHLAAIRNSAGEGKSD